MSRAARDGALAAVEEGFKVIRLKHHSKTPDGQWRGKATGDRDTVKSWFEGEAEPNYGIVANASGLVILDEDEDGALDRWARDHDVEIPPTRTVKTGKGRHFYFTAGDAQLGNASPFNRDGYAVDVRWNGYVVGPGSVHESGAVYEIDDDRDPAELPPKLRGILEAAQQRATPESAAPSQGEVSTDEHLDRWAQVAVEGCLDDLRALESVPLGADPSWDRTTFAKACRLVELSNGWPKAYPLEKAHEDFLANAPSDDDFGERQHEHKWNSAVAHVDGRIASPNSELDFAPMPSAAPKPKPERRTRFNAEWLLAQDFPEVQYTIPGLVPEGMSVLVGGPKMGKSWLCLDIAFAVASGGSVLGGIAVERRPVLYLALEDSDRRLQNRLRILGYTSGGKALELDTEIKPDETVEGKIAEFIQEHAGKAPLVILDTLGKHMPPARSNEGVYERDYRVAGQLKRIIDSEPGASLIVVHHTNKSAHGDFVDRVSGTNGIPGAADTVLLLDRERNKTTAALYVTSRDAEEGVYQLEQPSVGRWELAGGSLESARAAHSQEAVTRGVSDLAREIIDVVNDHPDGISPKEVADELGMDNNVVRTYLTRAAKSRRIEKAGRGRYTPVASVSSVTSFQAQSDESNTQYTSNTTSIGESSSSQLNDPSHHPESAEEDDAAWDEDLL